MFMQVNMASTHVSVGVCLIVGFEKKYIYNTGLNTGKNVVERSEVQNLLNSILYYWSPKSIVSKKIPLVSSVNLWPCGGNIHYISLLFPLSEPCLNQLPV